MSNHIGDGNKMVESPPLAPATLFGAWWEIPHPGTLEKVKCVTFEEAMDKWFEGFNIPVLVVDGVREDFSRACDRVRRYYDNPRIEAIGEHSNTLWKRVSELESRVATLESKASNESGEAQRPGAPPRLEQ